MTHVPFSGAGPAIQALLGGITQVAVVALPPALPYIESGAIKALAVTGAHRWIDLPKVPTMVDLGYKDFIAETFQAFLAPAKTAPDIVERLSAKSLEILKTPAISGSAAHQRLRGHRAWARGPAQSHRSRSAEMARRHRQGRHQAGLIEIERSIATRSPAPSAPIRSRRLQTMARRV